MAWRGLAAEFLQVPAVTRAYTMACVITTAAVVSLLGGRGVAMVTAGGERERRGVTMVTVGFPRAAPDAPLAPQQLDLLSPFQLYFNPHLVFRKFQVSSPSPCT